MTPKKRTRLMSRPETEEARPLNWRRAVVLALQELSRAGVLPDATVVLIGSHAHGAALPGSDVDLLILTSRERSHVKPVYGAHLQFDTVKRFEQRLNAGDDFAVASVRFGKLVSGDRRLWHDLELLAKTAAWPEWRSKPGQARLRLRLSRGLLETKDLEASREEYLVAATQIARALLLREHIYPLSRPELRDQLRTIGQDGLARALDLLMFGHRDEPQIRQLAEQLESELRTAQAAANP